MNMKKLYFRLMMVMMGLVTVSLTSCDDEEIAKTLEGTWKGDMYISSEWDGHYYNATYTEVTFLKDPYAFSSGTGYWVDYYSDAPWDYVANHIDWRVDLGDIHVNHGNKVAFYLINVSRPNYTGYHWGYDSWVNARGLTRTVTDSLNISKKPVRIIRPRD